MRLASVKTEAPPTADAPASAPSPGTGLSTTSVGPGAGQGERKIKPSETAHAPEVPADRSVHAGAVRSYKIGKPPKRPSPTLPPGVPTPTPDDEARKLVAGGPIVQEGGPKGDPELHELDLAERALFPRPLRGAVAGFSWDLPTPADDGGATVEATGLPPALLEAPAPPSEVAAEAAWLKSLTMPNLPARLDARVVKYLKFYRDDARGRNILRVWAKKCGRLTPAVKAVLAKSGLPTDLVWLSLIESGHNPSALSPAGAAGLWQLIPESARMYGLIVDRWVDERLDPERSTEAAVRYLSDLRARFGSWELAMAAYNMGHGGLLRSVRKFNTNDFWTLARYEAGLPWETTLYVPKIMATAIAMANKKSFGIDDVEQDPPLSFDTVSVSPNVDLGDVARAADSPLADVLALNSAYLTGRTPPLSGAPRRWPVRVPAGRGALTEQRLAEARHAAGATEPHVVRFGDTLESIAAEYGTTARELAQSNHVAPDERLRPGSVLLVARAADGAAKDPPDEEVVVVPARRFAEPGRTRLFYRVLPGDQMAEVAAAFGVAPSEVALWNALDPSATLQPGMTLQVFVPATFDASRTRCLTEHEARVLIAGTDEFFDYFEKQNGRKRIAITAKKGDTLAAIGKRYGMSPGMMERINRIPSSSRIAEGDKVIVYAKGGAPTVDNLETDVARALSAIEAPLPDLLPALPDAPKDGREAGSP
jgi:membrane-bound lytic murein transglycosylase D